MVPLPSNIQREVAVFVPSQVFSKVEDLLKEAPVLEDGVKEKRWYWGDTEAILDFNNVIDKDMTQAWIWHRVPPQNKALFLAVVGFLSLAHPP